MKKTLFLALTMAALAVPAVASSAELVTPQQMVKRALAGKMTSLASCNVARGSIARFKLGFDGKPQDVRLSGVPIPRFGIVVP